MNEEISPNALTRFISYGVIISLIILFATVAGMIKLATEYFDNKSIQRYRVACLTEKMSAFELKDGSYICAQVMLPVSQQRR